MPPNLTQLLDEISPKDTIYLCRSRAYDALESFPSGLEGITDFNAFQDLLGRFYNHVQNTLLGIPSSTAYNPGLHRGMAMDIMKEIYGPRGWMTPFEMMQTGYGGAGYDILQKVAMTMAQKEAHNWISIKVHRFWNRLSGQEQIDVGNEYLESYGHLYPPDLRGYGSHHITHNMLKMLINHPYLSSGLSESITI